jgi:molecular chaperone Hsp33
MILLALSVVSRRPGAGAFRSVFPNTARARRSRSLRWEGSSSTDSTTPTEVSDDKFAAFRNRNNRDDQVFSAMSGDGGIKVTAATVRNLLNDMSLQHTMTATPTDAMGRTVTCGLLLANGIQDEQIVQITMNGDGPIRGIVAIASGTGQVRGYVGSPGLGEMSLTDAVGKGSVQIVKNHPDWPRPYNGITAIRHGDIDRDIGIYLAESEQRSCALAAATAMNGILCTAAGGYLIEQLPGVEPETIARVEQNLAKLVQKDGGDELPANLLLSGVTPLDMAAIILDGLDMQPLQQIKPGLVCHCTEDRLFRSLRLLSKEEVDDILEKEEQIEARCQFCGKVYRMGAPEIRDRLAAAKGDPSKEDVGE